MAPTTQTPAQPKRCLGCGYILDGLPEPRCPECGRGFDPEDSATYTRGCTSARGSIIAVLVMWIAAEGASVLSPGGFLVALVATVVYLIISVRSGWMLTRPYCEGGCWWGWIGGLFFALLALVTCLPISFYLSIMFHLHH